MTVDLSHDASSASTWPGSRRVGSPDSRDPKTDGTAPRQRTLKHAFQMQEAKQRPQRHDRQLRRPPPQPRTRLDHECAHLATSTRNSSSSSGPSKRATNGRTFST